MDTLQEIQAVVDLLSQLNGEDEVFIAFSPPFTLAFEVDRKRLSRELKAVESIDEAVFDRRADEVAAILLAILEHKERVYVRDRTRHFEEFARENEGSEGGSNRETPDEFAARMDKQVELVRNHLYDERLQRRYDLKKTSKAPSFTSIDWDIKVKRVDAGLESMQPFPYATCRINFQREFSDNPFTIFGGRTFDSVQINFSRDEIVHLVRVLGNLRDSLGKIQEEVAG